MYNGSLLLKADYRAVTDNCMTSRQYLFQRSVAARRANYVSTIFAEALERHNFWNFVQARHSASSNLDAKAVSALTRVLDDHESMCVFLCDIYAICL